MDNAKKQLADQLTSSANVLVTISRDPTIDQVASCIALTLLLNKMGKHAAAVFSGSVPSALEFLKPEDTLETNTDSLRDFIIAIDKSKADKLRYKVEDDIVRIFITPYKTSISEDDLQFSQGDFNVDVVVGIGITKQQDIDQAITAHGRILHDAAVTTININGQAELGTINWTDPQASSLSELVTELAQALNGNLMDEQIATALLTGIVAETERFSNDKTSSQTMSISAALMAAGADQQLVATKLEESADIPLVLNGGKTGDNNGVGDDGEIDIDHSDESSTKQEDAVAKAEAAVDSAENQPPQVVEQPAEQVLDVPPPPKPSIEEAVPNQSPRDASGNLTSLSPGSKLMTAPPTLGGQLTANSQVESLEPSSDPLSLANAETPQILERSPEPPQPQPEPPKAEVLQYTPPPPSWNPELPKPADDTGAPKDPAKQTLTDLETSVGSPHAQAQEVNQARSDVSDAVAGSDGPVPDVLEPKESLGAQDMGDELHLGNTTLSTEPTPPTPQANSAEGTENQNQKDDNSSDPNAPPPVPPPIPFQFNS